MEWLIGYCVFVPLYYYLCVYPFLKAAKKSDKLFSYEVYRL